MNREKTGIEVSDSLCHVCEAARTQGNGRATSLAQAALRTAVAEMGGLPRRETCPMGRDGLTGCPLLPGSSGSRH